MGGVGDGWIFGGGAGLGEGGFDKVVAGDAGEGLEFGEGFDAGVGGGPTGAESATKVLSPTPDKFSPPAAMPV